MQGHNRLTLIIWLCLYDLTIITALISIKEGYISFINVNRYFINFCTNLANCIVETPDFTKVNLKL